MHYLAAAVMVGIYLYNVPLIFAIIWKKHHWAVAVGAFSPGITVKRAQKKLDEPPKGSRFESKKVIRSLRELIAAAKLEHFSARLLVGAGDAAKTAQLCGALRALAALLRQRAAGGLIDIRPDFAGEVFEGEVRAVISVRAGTALGALAKYMMGP